MTNRTVVCVDDEKIVLDSIYMQLKKNFSGSFSIELCTSGAEGIETVRDILDIGHEIPIVISDYIMPGMKGDEFLASVSAMSESTHTIILTGQATLDGVVSAINNAKLYRYISKPWEETDLVLTVEKAIESYDQKLEIRRLAQKYERLYLNMRETYLASINAFANAIDARDSYTTGHSQRVAEYSVMLAKACGFDDARIEAINHMGILHDIGKIGIRDSILYKQDKLTPEEYDAMKKHVSIGADILKGMSALSYVLPGIKYHHERYDGGGYEERIAMEQIPLEARIICIADAFDAMTSDRPYRKALSVEKALEEIDRSKGTQFDPRLAERFVSMIRAQLSLGQSGVFE